MQELIKSLLKKLSRITYAVAEGDPDSANVNVTQGLLNKLSQITYDVAEGDPDSANAGVT